jgi:hypothetical protein
MEDGTYDIVSDKNILGFLLGPYDSTYTVVLEIFTENM